MVHVTFDCCFCDTCTMATFKWQQPSLQRKGRTESGVRKVRDRTQESK